MKNRWDSLKRMFTQWKTLNERATGLGRDPHTGSIRIAWLRNAYEVDLKKCT
jgi:hypothetical protein